MKQCKTENIENKERLKLNERKKLKNKNRYETVVTMVEYWAAATVAAKALYSTKEQRRNTKLQPVLYSRLISQFR